jgi:hypothetical protein
MKFAGTFATHPRPKFGVSGRVAIAGAYEPVIRNRIIRLFRQRSDAYKNLAQSGMATVLSFLLKVEDANENLWRAYWPYRTSMLDGTHSIYLFASRLKT